jgi:hypothetical protein
MAQMQRETGDAIRQLHDELEREIRRREEMKTAIVPARRIVVMRE